MTGKITLPRCLTSLLGGTILAFGLYNIHSLSGVTEGGQLGLTLLLEHWFRISPALTSLVCNVICYGIGWKTLGKPFLAYSAVATGGFSLTYWIYEQFSPLWPGLAAHPLTAALLGAVFVGVGCGLCVRVGGAPSGDDALAMSLSRLWRMKIEYVYMIFDFSILVLSLTYIPLKRIVFSLVTVTLSSKLVGLVQRVNFPKAKN
ncbi:MAG: YitT family protein [Oscillospiraceae bacterium]|nr:YitT family protein [Oscillospiraceae bacterium]